MGWLVGTAMKMPMETVLEKKKDNVLGVPIVAQWVKNLTHIHEVVALIPGLAQWVKDLAVLQAVV